METSEELEWELYDIFISGIFAFPIYEHNAARRIVRYLLMRGVMDEEIANAIEGPTVDLRIWLNRGGKHLVGEWVIAWLNDSRDQYKNRRRTAGSRGRSRLQDRRIFYRDHDVEDDDAHDEGSPFSSSVQGYLSSSTTHRSSFSSDSNDSRWTKEDESDISSDYELEEEDDEEDVEDGDAPHSVQRRSSVEVEDEPRPRTGRPRDSKTLEILVESSTDSVPHYKIHRPQTLDLDPDALSLMRCPTGSWAIDAPDSGHVSDTPCSCLLPCLHSSSSTVHNDDDDIYDHPSTQAIRPTASLPVYCFACRSNLPHHEKIASDARQMMGSVCRNYVVAMDTSDAASEDARRCQEATTA